MPRSPTLSCVALLLGVAIVGCSSEGKLPFRDDTLFAGGSTGPTAGTSVCTEPGRYPGSDCDECMRLNCCSSLLRCTRGTFCHEAEQCAASQGCFSSPSPESCTESWCVSGSGDTSELWSLIACREGYCDGACGDQAPQ